MRYWKINNDNTVEKVYGTYEKPYPSDIIDQDSVDPSLWDIDGDGLRYENGSMRVITEQEAIDMRDRGELIRQENKPLTHKQIENNFIKLCNALFGTPEKRGFDEITYALEVLKQTNFQLAVDLGLKFSGVNQEGLREIGNKWWDDCAWHPEIE
jgi:hypothetical protein